MITALQFIGAILLTGGPAFLVLVWRPALLAATTDQRLAWEQAVTRRVRSGSHLGLALLSAATFASLWSVASTMTRAPLFSPATFAKLTSLVTQSEVGLYALLRILLAIALWAAILKTTAATAGESAPAGRPRHATPADLFALAAGAFMLATFTLTGHAVTVPGPPLPAAVAVDLVHFLAAAFWAGGLGYLAWLPWRDLAGDPGRPVVQGAVRRFSLLGLVSVAILVATGLLMSLQRIYGPLALFESRYGIDLLWKIGYLGIVLAIARGNMVIVRARRQAAGQGLSTEVVQQLRRRVYAETVALGLVVTAAGILSNQSPPFRVPIAVGPITTAQMRYEPATLEIPRGKPVRLTLVNTDSTRHSFVVKGLPYEGLRGHVHDPAAATWEDLVIYISPRGERNGAFTALQSGTYRVFCVVEDHADRGMVGTLVVK